MNVVSFHPGTLMRPSDRPILTEEDIAGVAAELNKMDTVSLRRAVALGLALIHDRQGMYEMKRVVLNVERGLSTPPPPRREIERIADDVAKRHSISVADLKGPSRKRIFAWPRQEAFWLCREQKLSDGRHRYSYPYIAHFFGGRDHTTVMHGVAAHEERLNVDRRAKV